MHGDDLEGAVSGRENEIRLLSTLQHFISSFSRFLFGQLLIMYMSDVFSSPIVR
jgi:hypothetical protein